MSKRLDNSLKKIYQWSTNLWKFARYHLPLSSVQLLSRVQFFVTPWIAAHQASSSDNPYSLRHIIEIRQVNNLRKASNGLNEKKSCTPLPLNQKLEMIKLNENRPKAKPLAPVSQLVNAKDKFLKEIKSATPVTTWVIRNWNSPVAGVERVWVVWIEDQTYHNLEHLLMVWMWSIKRSGKDVAKVCDLSNWVNGGAVGWYGKEVRISQFVVRKIKSFVMGFLF